LKVLFAIIILAAIILVGFFHERIIYSLPNSEFAYKWQLFLHAKNTEMLIKEAEKTPYNAIHFQKDYRNDPDFLEYLAQHPDQDAYKDAYKESYLANKAYLLDEGILKEVDEPDIQNFIDAAETTGLLGVRLTQRIDGAGWYLYHGLSWKGKNGEIHAFYMHGSAPNNTNCNELEEGKDPSGECHTHLFDEWYLDKWWRTE
jgi:hypothetical protein